jgi:hypothetical protein
VKVVWEKYHPTFVDAHYLDAAEQLDFHLAISHQDVDHKAPNAASGGKMFTL